MEFWETFDDEVDSIEKSLKPMSFSLEFKGENINLLQEESIKILTDLCHQIMDSMDDFNIPNVRSNEFLLERIQSESVEDNPAEILRNVSYALDEKVRILLNFMKELEKNNENLALQSSLLSDKLNTQTDLEDISDSNKTIVSEIHLLEEKIQNHERKMEEFSESKRILEKLMSNENKELLLKNKIIEDLEEENNRLMAELIEVTEKANKRSAKIAELAGNLNDEKELNDALKQRCESLDVSVKHVLTEEKKLEKEKNALENKINKKTEKRKSADSSLFKLFFRE